MFKVTEDDLINVFKHYGASEVKIIRGKDGRSKGLILFLASLINELIKVRISLVRGRERSQCSSGQVGKRSRKSPVMLHLPAEVDGPWQTHQPGPGLSTRQRVHRPVGY